VRYFSEQQDQKDEVAQREKLEKKIDEFMKNMNSPIFWSPHYNPEIILNTKCFLSAHIKNNLQRLTLLQYF
jgi:hypothetical protein